MRYNHFGRTGLFVSQLCLGTMSFGTNLGKYAAAGGLEPEEAEPIFRRAFNAGVNFIDTANVYATGQSEEITGRALKALGVARDQVIVATKCEHAVGTGPEDAGASRHHIISQVKASLKRLGTDYIDLYQLHGWDPVTPLEETVRALEDLVRVGHVRYVDVSNWAAWQIEKALGVAERLNATPFRSVQAYYSLAARDVEREIVPMLHAEGLGLMARSPLAGGYLSGKYREVAAGGGLQRRARLRGDHGRRLSCHPDRQYRDQSKLPAAVLLQCDQRQQFLLGQPNRLHDSRCHVVMGVKKARRSCLSAPFRAK